MPWKSCRNRSITGKISAKAPDPEHKRGETVENNNQIPVPVKPAKSEYSDFFQSYIDLVESEDVAEALKEDQREMMSFIADLPEDKLEFAYNEGKWTTREVILHVTKSEVWFSNQVRQIAGVPIPEHFNNIGDSLEQAQNRSQIRESFQEIREASIQVFENLKPELFSQTVPEAKYQISALAHGFLIAGHSTHHAKVIRERYL